MKKKKQMEKKILHTHKKCNDRAPNNIRAVESIGTSSRAQMQTLQWDRGRGALISFTDRRTIHRTLILSIISLSIFQPPYSHIAAQTKSASRLVDAQVRAQKKELWHPAHLVLMRPARLDAIKCRNYYTNIYLQFTLMF